MFEGRVHPWVSRRWALYEHLRVWYVAQEYVSSEDVPAPSPATRTPLSNPALMVEIGLNPE